MDKIATEQSKGLVSEKSKDVRSTNITAARAVADVVRTSLGPRGMDKMVSFNKAPFLTFNDQCFATDTRSKRQSADHQ